MTGVRAEVVTDPRALPASDLAAWHALAVAAALPYSTPAWMLAFWRERHAADAALRLVLVRDGGELIGVGPFYGPGAGHRRPPSAWWLLGSGIGQRSAPLAAPGRTQEVAAVLARSLAEARPSPGVLELAAFDAASPWPAALAGAWPGGARLTPGAVASGFQIHPHAEGMDAWFAARSQRFRAQTRRSERQVEARGGAVRRITEPAEVPVAVEALARLQAGRSELTGRTSSFGGTALSAVVAATRAMVVDGSARLWVCESAGEVVGAQLAVVAGSRMCTFNEGSSPGWEKESLGQLLRVAVIRDAHELGLTAIDMGAGDQEHKRRIADDDDPIAWWTLHPDTIAGRAARAAALPAVARRRVKAAVKALPPEWQARARRLARR